MEEKERYEYFFGTNTIKDNKTNQFYGCAVDLLNQQDKRLKELEQENQQLKQQLITTEKALELACEHIKEDLKCDDTEGEIYNYFKTQAKEMLESE